MKFMENLSSPRHGRIISLSVKNTVLALICCVTLSGCNSSENAAAPQVGDPARTAVASPMLDRAKVIGAGSLSAISALPETELRKVEEAQEPAFQELRACDQAVIGTAVSVCEGKSVLLVLTKNRSGRLPSKLRGVEVVEFPIGEVQAQSYYCGTSTGRPAECNGGTLGAIVTDGTRNYWLSNWHVLVDGQGKIGDNICSPGRVDAGCGASPVVGTLSRFVPVRLDGSLNSVDCAIARITAGSVSPIEAAGTNSFKPTGQIRNAFLGMAVKKVGRATGYTTGTVIGLNVRVDVNYGYGVGTFAGCVMTTNMCKKGDSGSLVCDASTNNPVALLFAANSSATFGCPIGSVFSALGVHIAN